VASKSTADLAGSSSSSSNTTGRLRHITEDLDEEVEQEEVENVLPDAQTNNTNEEVLPYFARVTNHYLRLVKNSPTIAGQPPIFIGIYVDDIIYFSASDAVEKCFEEKLATIGSVYFMGQVSLFLGTEFSWVTHADGHISVSLTQQSFAETLVESLGLDHIEQSTFLTPYCSGHSIDTVPEVSMSSSDRDALRLKYQSLVGSLNWLAHTTRPDLSTAVSLLTQHQSNPSPGHYTAACYVTCYVASTKNIGIYFTSCKRSTLESFLHFPLPEQVMSMSDANWGPQDASTSSKVSDLPLFVSRSMSVFYIDLLPPLHWISKCQSVTAASSAESEIYATDECVKFLLELVQLFDFLNVRHIFMPSTNVIYNDNQACVQWSKRVTTKGLRRIQMHKNRIRENIATNFVSIQHIDGKINLADIFTKEMKDTSHFVELHDLIMCKRLRSWHLVDCHFSFLFSLPEFSFEGGVSGFQILTQSFRLG
jgi:hypothetical protein